jgi:hypothetical protein
MSNQIVKCRTCFYWASSRAEVGLCKRRAPRPTESLDQIAYWPETAAGDMCGEGQEHGDPPVVSTCGACLFWRNAGDSTGIYPLDRLGTPLTWWQRAGHCARFAPSPSSEMGRHGFWRVTHRTDGCAEGKPIVS